MKRRLGVTMAGITLIAFLLSACSGLPAQAGLPKATDTAVPTATVPAVEETPETTPVAESHGGPVVDYVSLIDTLRAGGATAEPAGQITQPFFTPTGQVITIIGADVQVFEYPDEAAVGAEAALVAEDGSSIGTTMVNWVEAPHFYRAGKIIVLYVGSDAGVMAALEAAMSPQFAGR